MSSSSYGWVGVVLAITVVMPAYAALSRWRNRRSGPPEPEPIRIPEGYGSLTVRRPHAGLHAAARAMDVVVDGVPRGRLKAGAAVALAVAPGVHDVKVAIGRRGSGEQTFTTREGHRAAFEAELVVDGFSTTIDLRPVS